MAEVRPFNGIRYNIDKIGNLSEVTSPPYDVISPDDRVYYHQLHPNNFVRLILGEEFEDDSDTNNRFTRARTHLESWLESGVLAEDPEPAIYVYQQQFERDGGPAIVRGLIAAIKLHGYEDKVILPHENTLAKPKSQLIQLIRQTSANLDSIYGLYADPEGTLEAVMDRVAGTRPDEESVDKDGVRHQLWVLSDPSQTAIITEFMRDKQVAIADGHHRYETALAYRSEMRAQSNGDSELPSDYTLMTLLNVHQKDLTIYPTHRVVANVDSQRMENLEGSLEELFEIASSSRADLLADMARIGGIGLYRTDSVKVLKMKPQAASLLRGSEASRRLELNVLHSLILDRSLGIDEDRLRDQTNIIYTRDASEAMALVDSGERQAAFLLNRIEVKSVLDIASAGERMPQKATYFYPKLLSGLVLRKMA